MPTGRRTDPAATRARPRLAVVLLAAVAALLLAGCGGTSQAATGGTGFVAGDGSLVLLAPADRLPAPDLVGQTLDGTTFRLSDHRGQVVAVNVWASWCAPCRAEAPTLQRVWTDLAPDGLVLVGLDTRDTEAAARAFVARYGITYPNVVDTDGRLQLGFRDTLPPQAIPSTLVIDREGRVAGRALGKASESSLRGLVEPLLREPPPSTGPSGPAAGP